MNSSTNNSSLAETDAAVIRAELDRLLADRRFSGARQMSAFLRYIVCETLNGNGSRIKAYTVGVDALGKPDDFDAQADPSVRVLALRLRKTLTAAYEDNPDCLARVMLRVGTYVPEFYKPEAFAEHDAQQVLQRPDHASFNDAPGKAESEKLTAKFQDTVESGSEQQGLNSINQRLDGQRQANTGRFRRVPLIRRGPLCEALAKNTAAFTRVESVSPDFRVPLGAIVILAALWQLTLNPANANDQIADTVHGMSLTQSITVDANQNASFDVQELD